MLKLISLLIFLLYCVNSELAIAARNDVTGEIRSLGTPFFSRYRLDSLVYARNIWDIAVFKNKLFFGAGNSSNKGPAPNAGPVPVICFDPKSETFEAVYSVSEEQINQFFVIDNSLYIPGTDPMESWEFGNIYKTIDGVNWSKQRSIPEGVHAYGMVNFQDELFVGLGTKKGGSVAVSQDQGRTWGKCQLNSGRIYDFLVINNKLYATSIFYSNEIISEFNEKQINLSLPIYEYTSKSTFSARPDLSNKQTFFPEGRYKEGRLKFLKIEKHLEHDGMSFFIASTVHNDHQSLPFDAYMARSLDANNIIISRIPIPTQSIPWDILEEGGRVYILIDNPGKTPREISVIYSDDFLVWNELLYFRAPTFARSFAVLDNTFYFGLGGEIKDEMHWQHEELSSHTGEIIAVKTNLMKK